MGIIYDNQYLSLMFGGAAPYRIDKDDTVTGRAFNALYVSTAAILTTVTDSEDQDVLADCNIQTDVDEIEAGMFIAPENDKTIKAITVKSDNAGVVWGLTKVNTS